MRGILIDWQGRVKIDIPYVRDALESIERGDRIMFNIVFNIVWYGLIAWTCVGPAGYGPYVLLGVNCGEVMATLWFGLGYGYLLEEGDFNFDRFVGTTVAFGLLGGFYVGKLSFQPGTDAYNYAITLIFMSFCFTFGYRYLQYGLRHFLGRF